MKFFVAAAASLLLSSVATDAAFAANGCPPGTVSTTASGGDAYSSFFDVFFVPAATISTCHVSVQTSVVHDSNTIRVYSADYRGLMTVAKGETGRLIVTQGRSTDLKTYVGPYDDELNHRNFLVSGTAGKLESSIEINLIDASDDFSGAALDTIDYAFAGTTTLTATQASIDALSADRTAVVASLQSTANLLVGINRPLESPDEIAFLGGVGSRLAGITGRRNLADGYTIDGGAVLFDQSPGGADAKGVLVSGALRYLRPSDGRMRPFIEVGARAAKLQELTLTRHYGDGSVAGTSVTSDNSGNLVGGYAKAGLLYQPDASNEIALSGTLAHDALHTDAFSEAFSTDNLFAASVDSASTHFTTVKLGAAWTAIVRPGIDMTLNAGVGRIFADGDLSANVMFVGAVSSAARDENFVEYGARVGFKPTPMLDADIFLQGVTGSISDTELSFGGALRHAF